MSTPSCISSTGVNKTTITSGGQLMHCVGNNVWQADDGTLRFGSVTARERWYAENPAQAVARATPPWLPWVAGGLAVGAVAWFFFRK